MIKFIDKDIDRSDRIVITHIVIQPLSEQCSGVGSAAMSWR
jgi:hypothetical protein